SSQADPGIDRRRLLRGRAGYRRASCRSCRQGARRRVRSTFRAVARSDGGEHPVAQEERSGPMALQRAAHGSAARASAGVTTLESLFRLHYLALLQVIPFARGKRLVVGLPFLCVAFGVVEEDLALAD